jgi:hypothetical protein
MTRFVILFFLLMPMMWAQAQKKDTVTIIGVGDIMMGSNYPNGGSLPPNGGGDLLKEVAPILTSADITMGNLEGVLLDDGGVMFLEAPLATYRIW